MMPASVSCAAGSAHSSCATHKRKAGSGRSGAASLALANQSRASTISPRARAARPAINIAGAWRGRRARHERAHRSASKYRSRRNATVAASWWVAGSVGLDPRSSTLILSAISMRPSFNSFSAAARVSRKLCSGASILLRHLGVHKVSKNADITHRVFGPGMLHLKADRPGTNTAFGEAGDAS